jgi:hypothetical protein
MDAEDPEEYIRDLERGLSQPPGAAPKPPSKNPKLPPGRSNSGQFSRQSRFRAVAKLANTRQGWLILTGAVVVVLAVVFLSSHYSDTTVEGNLIMINSGATDSIKCNDGNLKLDGDNNTYTVTEHCRRLEVFGSANHVSVDSADTISVFGNDNAVTYHSGSPAIDKTGNNNTVSQRLTPR